MCKIYRSGIQVFNSRHYQKDSELHDLHTWMTSSYMTYIACYTLRSLHVFHPNTEGQQITGVQAYNTHTHTLTQTVRQRVKNKPANRIILCMHDHKHNLSLYLPQIRPHRTRYESANVLYTSGAYLVAAVLCN